MFQPLGTAISNRFGLSHMAGRPRFAWAAAPRRDPPAADGGDLKAGAASRPDLENG